MVSELGAGIKKLYLNSSMEMRMGVRLGPINNESHIEAKIVTGGHTFFANHPMPEMEYHVFYHLGNTRVVYTVDYIRGLYDYSAYGRVTRQFVAAGAQHRYKSTAHERDLETGYDYRGARWSDPGLGRFLSVDPLAEERSWVSPFNYVQNNPINRVDPTGAIDNPVYDTDGNLLGTDNQGLHGKAIIMDRGKFSQGMNHEDAMANSLGYQGLKDDAAKTKFSESYKSLPSRPDYDGKLTLSEANNWYRTGGGNPLFVDASKIDLSPVKKSDFSKVGSSLYENFFFSTNTETGFVYGTIKLTLTNGEGSVRLGNTKTGLLDNYGFEQQEGRYLRNIGTWLGKQNAGDGKSFDIYNYGTGKVK